MRLSVLLQALTLCISTAVTDMFFDLPFNLDANDDMCFQRFGIHMQYNWAAYK